MSAKIPLPVARYLESSPDKANPLAYLKLDAENRLLEKGGELKHFGITNLNSSLPIEEQLPMLEGLLPSGEQPVIITNSQASCVKYIDLHLYSESDHQWLVLIDTTEAGTKLQSEQQVRLNNDFNEERKSG